MAEMQSTTENSESARGVAAPPFLHMQGICKDFGPVRVLFDVDFELKPGEVHALIGENGAGKSTLMKILAGYHRASEGSIVLDDKPVRLASSGAAEAAGIVLIHQELNLAEHLTVEENIFLGREVRKSWFLDKRAMIEQSRHALAELRTDIDPNTRVSDLSVSQKQMVEIAKAISREARVLIMDEPSSVLTPNETGVLFDLIGRLKGSGVTVVYISHKLDEVERISDRVTILRDGKVVTTRPTAEIDKHEMASLMVGRDIEEMYPDKAPIKKDHTALRVHDVTVPGWVESADFELYQGEVLGFAGLVGAGRTELMEGILGLRPRAGGSITQNGRALKVRSLNDAVNAGIVYLSEDRKGKGLLVNMQLRPNITLLALERFCRPLIDVRAERKATEKAVDDFDIRVSRLDAVLSTLSGGNQQKVALAKIMQVEPQILILDEPTRGIDVGTKRQIYFFIHELARQGKSCILISSELQEIIGLSHRVVVMHAGRVTGTLEGDEITEQEIIRYATGLKDANHKPREAAGYADAAVS